MAETTEIAWADATFNPWIGCTKVAPECANCYAERDMDKRLGIARWGPGGTRVYTTAAYWRQPLKWNRDAEKSGTRRRVFCASLADVFEEWEGQIHSHDGLTLDESEMRAEGLDGSPVEILRQDLFYLIDKTPWLDWLLLTKRPENIRRMWVGGETRYRPNVWLGTSAGCQQTADRMIPRLMECRDLAPVLFLSCEPMLGLVDIFRMTRVGEISTKSAIDWVIVGGESGSGSRPMHPDWVRNMKYQCSWMNIPFFFKQHGEFCSYERRLSDGVWVGQNGSEVLDKDLPSGLSHDSPVGRWRYLFASSDDLSLPVLVEKTGKKQSGFRLDGKIVQEFPHIMEVER